MGKVSSILGKIFVVIMALITLFPFVYMILSSLMTFQKQRVYLQHCFQNLFSGKTLEKQ